MDIDKAFFSAFNLQEFTEQEAEFDRQAQKKQKKEIKTEVQKLFVDLKNILDNTEKTMNRLFSETDPDLMKQALSAFKNEYQQLVNKFAQLEIEVNRL